MPLNRASPAYRRAQRVSRANSFFDEEVMKKANHREVLLQNGIRESGSYFRPEPCEQPLLQTFVFRRPTEERVTILKSEDLVRKTSVGMASVSS
jgi:hypothetical protein